MPLPALILKSETGSRGLSFACTVMALPSGCSLSFSAEAARVSSASGVMSAMGRMSLTASRP